jgi:hypothetical protein
VKGNAYTQKGEIRVEVVSMWSDLIALCCDHPLSPYLVGRDVLLLGVK